MSDPRDVHVDFPVLASAALSHIDSLLGQWLPGGKSNGVEYKVLNPTRADSGVGSFSVNVRNGKWSDFATGDSGGDLIDLYAYLFGGNLLDAAIGVAAAIGFDLPSRSGFKGNPDAAPIPAKTDLVNNNPVVGHKKEKKVWKPVFKVDDDLLASMPVAHYVRGKPEQTWNYRDADGGVLGFIHRFTNSTGGKEFLPLTPWENIETGKQGWRWRAFAEPRPLYGLDELAAQPNWPVLLVEGEKCADAARKILDGWVVVSWPGGSKAVGKIDWHPLIGRNVYAWADCDAQRERLAREEKAAGVDKLSKPLLAADNQPGMRAMRYVHDKLVDLGSKGKFNFVGIPKPGEKKSGWDVADAIDEGMDADGLLKFIGNTTRQKEHKKQKEKRSINDGDLHVSNGKIVTCLANIYDILVNDPEWDGVLAYDEFAYVICKRKPPPYEGGVVGEWDANDDAQLAMWLTRNYSFAPSTQQTAEAAEVVARENKYHPVRSYLDGLKWDGEKRVDDWVTEYIGVAKSPYIARISRWFLMGMVARVMEPGVKFDCCLVLEGDQGRRKSSMLRVLGGEWFGDTDLDLHNKDSMGSIRGKWLYEFAELGSLARSESTRQKSFLSRQIDQYRPPYAHRDIRSPRQLVFGGSTNEWSWNKDATGGRRFWPVHCDDDIDCDGLASVRDQLFAEAVELYKSGNRYWPTTEEQKKIFDPEQIKRNQSDGYIDLLHDWVCAQVSEFSISDAAYELKIDPARLTRDIQTRIGQALRTLGCTKKERRTHVIRYWYKPPKRSEATSETGDESVGVDDAIPF